MRAITKATMGGIALVGSAALVLSGCAATPSTGGDTSAPAEDLTLSIGTVLPQTGSLAFLGPPEEAGVALAVQEINEAAAGITVDVTYGDSGDADNKAFETTVTRHLDAGVSALIGAASSGVTKLFLDQAVSAGTIVFSPANTSPDFTTWDDDNLYWRTAPSDLLQGEVLGNYIAEEGISNLGIIYLNDAYGTGLEAVVADTFEAAGGTVVASEPFNNEDTNFDAQVSTILAANPEAIVVIAFDQTATIVPAFANGGFDTSKFYFVDGNLGDWSTDGKIPLSVSIEGTTGTLPGPDTSEGDFRERLSAAYEALGNEPLVDFAYAAESYDAVVLLALASLKAGSTEAADIAANLASVSGAEGGEKCDTFAACAELLAGGATIDYDGPSGGINFDEAGDPTEASIGIYEYDASNKPVAVDFR